MDFKDGFLLVDKEKGETSFDVVRKVRRALGLKKVGHAGTLDKLATGLLVFAFGEGTKLLEYLVGMDKVYEVTAKFGYKSDSYDAEGPIHEVNSELQILREDVLAVIDERFVGRIDQMPPLYSALKVGGRRASDRVRAGEVVSLKARPVQIDAFEVLDFRWPEVDFRIHCGSGTYVRSLVHDLGEALEVGGYVLDLRRTSVGPFSLSRSIKSGLLSNKIDQFILTFDDIVGLFNVVEFSLEDSVKLKHGKEVLCNKVERKGCFLASSEGKVFAVLEGGKAEGCVKVRKGLNLI